MRNQGKIRKFAAIALIMVMCFAAACNSGDGESEPKDSIETGVWTESTFVNEWANIKFEMPSDYHSLSEEEIQQLIGDGEELIFSNGANKTVVDIAKTRTVYELVVTNDVGIPNLMLVYENVDFNALTKNISAEDYISILESQFTSLTDIDYKLTETVTYTIAGEEYNVAKFVMMDIVNQDYFVRKQDGVMITFILTYSTEYTEDAYALIDAVTAAE